MRYTIAQTELAKAAGLEPKYHNTNKTGELMVVNEEELADINSDVQEAAASLGGELLTLEELKNQTNRWNYE